MTRIIAGFAGSIPLTVPRTGTRPTSDRVREAIFSALEARDALHGARVVDLFAGSGALGLEAASRGAHTVTLVERAPAAVRVCRENASKVLHNAPKDARPTITVEPKAVTAFLETSTADWDLAFVDPPYDISDEELARGIELLVPRLESGAIVVIERATSSNEPRWPAGIRLDRDRKYGDTTLWWASAD